MSKDQKFCVDCPVNNQCIYAPFNSEFQKIWGNKHYGNLTSSDIEDLGDYGKCVYNNDNDVMDNQIVVLKYKNNGPLINFHAVATTKEICQRTTEIFGSHGQIISRSASQVELTDFRTNQTIVYNQSDHIELQNNDYQQRFNSHGGAVGIFIDELQGTSSTNLVNFHNDYTWTRRLGQS